ncbi:hypothetical protein N7540_001762 [Penicillium herquei]|nr:hypothetical protein N7540_001762 [Penicillium herquei]
MPAIAPPESVLGHPSSGARGEIVKSIGAYEKGKSAIEYHDGYEISDPFGICNLHRGNSMH